MRVTREEVERIAELAALKVEEESRDELTSQIRRILDYVAQLEKVQSASDAQPFRPGPEATPLREDRIVKRELAFGPEVMAPSFEKGLFIVPKLRVMEDV